MSNRFRFSTEARDDGLSKKGIVAHSRYKRFLKAICRFAFWIFTVGDGSSLRGFIGVGLWKFCLKRGTFGLRLFLRGQDETARKAEAFFCA